MSTDFNLKILTGEMCASAVVARSNNHFHGIGGREIASEVWDRRIKLTHAVGAVVFESSLELT
jgi:hypothetical protein